MRTRSFRRQRVRSMVTEPSRRASTFQLARAISGTDFVVLP